MTEETTLSEVLGSYPPPETSQIDAQLKREIARSRKKIVVIDDDPTGVQTVFGVSVYTDWTYQSVLSGFMEDTALFFILTNSRAYPSETAKQINADIAENVIRASEETKKDFILVSRSDSTLRGHYPLETETLRDALADHGLTPDGEILCPFFLEGGRYTDQNIHYVQIGEKLIPAGQTEFARDKTFGYENSRLDQWIEEKTQGNCRAEDVACISVQKLRSMDIDRITEILLQAENFSKIVVNALCYADVKAFCIAFFRAVRAGKRFIFRSAAAIPKVLGGIPDQALLTKKQLVSQDSENGGLIVVGSHVKRTTEQLEALLGMSGVEGIEFNQHLVTDEDRFAAEAVRVQTLIREKIAAGITTAVYTRRQRFDVGSGNKEDELRTAKKISDAITGFVSSLDVRPSFILAKGGITSSDIGTMGLRVKKAVVLGQVLPGVPVWLTGAESRFPGLPLIIFPGNVGGPGALLDIVRSLTI